MLIKFHMGIFAFGIVYLILHQNDYKIDRLYLKRLIAFGVIPAVILVGYIWGIHDVFNFFLFPSGTSQFIKLIFPYTS